jgi:hypothetical protein
MYNVDYSIWERADNKSQKSKVYRRISIWIRIIFTRYIIVTRQTLCRTTIVT